MQIRWKPLAALILMVMPLSAQTSEPRYLSEWDHMCKATLADGTKYEVWDRLLVTEWRGEAQLFASAGPLQARLRRVSFTRQRRIYG
jgi:hypothetical protein